MSYFLTLSSFTGDKNAAAKKLALMFRMTPQQANSIIEKVAKGQAWQTPSAVSDKQASVAENYLRSIGFQVERSGQEAEMSPIAEPVALEAEPESQAPPPQESAVPTLTTPQSNSNGFAIGFHGNGSGLFKIMLVNWILTILTLGIYSFWGKTKVRRYLCEQSSFVGDRFYYHGTGGELFRGALIFGAMFGLFNLGLYTVGQVWGLEARGIAELCGVILILLLLPVIMVGAFRYRLSRTAWRGIRFSFRGKRKSALWLYIKGSLLMLLTFYFYWPFFEVKLQKFWRGESYFGNQSFKYDGKGQDIFLAFFLMIVLYIVTIVVPATLPMLFPEMEKGLKDILPIMMYSFWYRHPVLYGLHSSVSLVQN